MLALVLSVVLAAPCSRGDLDCYTRSWANDVARLEACEQQKEHLQNALDASKQLNQSLRQEKNRLEKESVEPTHTPYFVGGFLGGIALTLAIVALTHS